MGWRLSGTDIWALRFALFFFGVDLAVDSGQDGWPRGQDTYKAVIHLVTLVLGVSVKRADDVDKQGDTQAASFQISYLV